MSSNTGNKTWGEIREDFLGMCRGASAAAQEAWAHLTQGYREIFSKAEVPEAFEPEDSEDVGIEAAGPPVIYNDFILCDRATIYYLASIYNLTDQTELEPEPSGYAGRTRFLETPEGGTRGKPPVGTVQYWVRAGSKIYLRPTPQDATTLMLHYRRQAPILTAADAALKPVTPVHLDLAIALAAGANYYRLHPDLNVPAAEGLGKPSAELQGEVDRLLGLAMPRDVRGGEMRASQHAQRLRGYRMSPRH